MYKTKSGFTIVELLIVIVVIAILAAISIVAYNGVQSRAQENSIKLDMQNAGKKLALLRVDTGSWPAQTDAGLEAAKISLSQSLYDTAYGNFLYCGTTSTANYVLLAKAKNGKTYVSGSNVSFREYANPNNYVLHSDYGAICSEFNGTGGARYGYTTADGWRLWTRNS